VSERPWSQKWYAEKRVDRKVERVFLLAMEATNGHVWTIELEARCLGRTVREARWRVVSVKQT